MRQKPRYFLSTFGCQMNERDAETLAGFCAGLGYERTAEPGLADLAILNTCCVRGNAENRLYGNLGNLKPLKDARPEMVITVCGCLAQEPGERERIKRDYPQVDLVFGPQNLQDFPLLLQRVLSGEGRLFEVDEGPGEVREDLPRQRTSGLKAWVTIMQGCDNFCSYCIVPYVRGRERSRQPAKILEEVTALAGKEVREITLLGQNVNSYGRDLGSPGTDFAALLREIEGVEGIGRVRFMTSHPKDLSDRLIAAMAECGKVCEHLHLPVQAGSSRILDLMHRGYDRERYLDLVDRLRAAVPEIALTTDIIVGFPGETEDDFQETLELVRRVRFDGAFTFAYSPRHGTKAADLPGQISEETKQDRLYRLIAVQNEISREVNEKMRGLSVEVLVEGPSERNTEIWCGRNRGNKLVHFPGPAVVGSLVQVRITRPQSWTLHGEMAGAETTGAI